jgi:hypothetical protein
MKMFIVIAWLLIALLGISIAKSFWAALLLAIFVWVLWMIVETIKFAIRDTDWRSVTRNSLVAVRDVMVLWAVIIATGFVTMHLIGYTP